jgi:hypothetical protein
MTLPSLSGQLGTAQLGLAQLGQISELIAPAPIAPSVSKINANSLSVFVLPNVYKWMKFTEE